MSNEVPKSDPRPSMLSEFDMIAQMGKTGMPIDLANGPHVTMIFPKPVMLQLDDNQGLVKFAAGVQEVPTRLSTHKYLRDNGVKLYSAGKAVDLPAGDKAPVVPAPNLAAMTKAEIAEHAAEVHNLDLDPKLTKDEMIATVEEHAAATGAK